MKNMNDVKVRLIVRALCKFAKSRGLELESLSAMIEEEWEKA